MAGGAWDVSQLDLGAYLERVGVPPRPPGRAALDELLVAHARTFSFDNIDVLLGIHPGVGLPEVQAKFVGRRRGGYCFEHATLAGAVLQTLGYAVERRLARVEDAWEAPRTHLDLVVTLPDGSRWLADPGIGRPPLGAMALADGLVQDLGGWRHRLRVVDDPELGWLLERDHHGEWETMHTTERGVVRPVDVRLGHHYTSTAPSSPFRSSLMIGRYDGEGHTAITVAAGTCAVTSRRAGQPTSRREVTLDEVVATSSALAGGLTSDELVGLRQVLEELHATP